jgi:hypothetical protein
MAYRTPLGKKKSVAGGWVMDHAPTSGDGSCPPRRVDAVDPVDAHAADFRAHERDERVGRAPDEGDVDRSAVRPTCWGEAGDDRRGATGIRVDAPHHSGIAVSASY